MRAAFWFNSSKHDSCADGTGDMPTVRFRGNRVLGDGAPCEWTLPASVVTTITCAPTITALPGAPAHVAGLTALDVGIVPVFRLSATPKRMLLCEFNESPVGILVDEVSVLDQDVPGRLEGATPLDLEELLRGAHKAMRMFHGSGESER